MMAITRVPPTAACATSRSSKSSNCPPISCVRSCPLPAITTTSPSRRAGERGRDRGPAIGFDDDVGLEFVHAVEDVTDDVQRVLQPWVVRCHNDPIGEPRGDRAHLRPLLPVAAAACAEHEDHGRARIGDRPCGREHLGESVGGVGVVDDHAETERSGGVDRLESSRDRLDAGQAVGGDRWIDAQLDRGHEGAQRVHDVEAPADGHPHVEAPPAVRMGVAGHLDVAHVVERELDHPDVVVAGDHVGQQPTVRIIGVHDRRAERSGAGTGEPWPGSTPRSSRGGRDGHGRGW